MSKVKPNSIHAWILASRPKTLTGAIIPVMLGTSLAVMNGNFQWIPAVICVCFAGLMQIAANFINDLYDFLKGSDREDRLGPERACAQGWISAQAMQYGIAITITLACLIGSTLLLYAGKELIFIGVICILFAFLYTTGPYPLSYKGWGDLLVLLFFGFVPVGGTYYVQTLGWNNYVTITSLACGLVIDTLLVVNNYRDRVSDAASGKRTLIVRYGECFGKYLYLLLGITAAILCLYFLYEEKWMAAILPQLYLIPHYHTWKKMIEIHHGKKLNSVLGMTSRNMLLFGTLLSIGIILS